MIFYFFGGEGADAAVETRKYHSSHRSSTRQ